MKNTRQKIDDCRWCFAANFCFYHGLAVNVSSMHALQETNFAILICQSFLFLDQSVNQYRAKCWGREKRAWASSALLLCLQTTYIICVGVSCFAYRKLDYRKSEKNSCEKRESMRHSTRDKFLHVWLLVVSYLRLARRNLQSMTKKYRHYYRHIGWMVVGRSNKIRLPGQNFTATISSVCRIYLFYSRKLIAIYIKYFLMHKIVWQTHVVQHRTAI